MSLYLFWKLIPEIILFWGINYCTWQQAATVAHFDNYSTGRPPLLHQWPLVHYFPSVGAEMLFSPSGVSECFREWGDLEKGYQQIQASSFHRLSVVRFVL